MTGEIMMTYARWRRLVFSRARNNLRFLRMCGLLAVALGLLLLPWLPSWQRIELLVLGVILLIELDVIALVKWLRMRGTAGSPWRYEVTDSLIGVHSPVGDAEFQWSMVRKAYKRRNAWVFELPSEKVAIPRMAFSTEDVARIDGMVIEK